MSRPDLSPYRGFSCGSTQEKLRIHVRYHIEGDPVLQRKQVVEFSFEASAPDDFEIEHHIRQNDVDMDFIFENTNGAVDDVVELVGFASCHGIGGRSGAIPECGGRDQTRCVKARQRRRNLPRHAKGDARTNRRTEAAKWQDRHAPTEWVPWKFSRRS